MSSWWYFFADSMPLLFAVDSYNSPPLGAMKAVELVKLVEFGESGEEGQVLWVLELPFVDF